MIRIIGGDFGGRKMWTPKGYETRPTPERVREALFNILQTEITGANFLDLFAGSGSVGFEALSRGAGRVTFVENSPKALEIIRRNLKMLRAGTEARCVSTSAFVYGDLAGEDFIFVSPPYPQIERMSSLGRFMGPKASEDTWWILQHPSGYAVEGVENFWEPVETRDYGRNALTFFRKKG